MSNDKAAATWHGGMTPAERAYSDAYERRNRAGRRAGRLSALALVLAVLALVCVVQGTGPWFPLLALSLVLTFTGRGIVRRARRREYVALDRMAREAMPR